MQRLLSITLIMGVTVALAGDVAWGGQRAVEEWVARYDNSAGSDYARGMAIDDHGNVYVTGESMHQTTGYLTVKYDPNGEEQWATLSDGMEVGPAIAVDALGSVFITGANQAGDCTTFKLDPNGNQLWQANYDGPGNGWDHGEAIALDNSGGVYVTGVTIGAGTGQDYTTIKYNSDSNEPVWAARYNGPANGSDVGNVVAVDASGNVYVAGWSEGIGTGFDLVTVKYDTNGNQLWVARYNGPENGPDGADDITLDGAGNVFVAGGVNYNSYRGTGDYITIKYSADNNEPAWAVAYNGPADGADNARGIAVDASGNVCVTGSSDGGATDDDYATIKYDPDGDELWVARYNGPSNSRDFADYIALDDSGNIYVAGGSSGPKFSDYATIKYDANGIELWTARYDGPANGTDYPCGLALESSGEVYVAGWSHASGTYADYATVKYKQCTQTGDIDCDRDVDLGDFGVLGKYWLESGCGECAWADLDDDNDVGANDLRILAHNWLAGLE